RRPRRRRSARRPGACFAAPERWPPRTASRVAYFRTVELEFTGATADRGVAVEVAAVGPVVHWSLANDTNAPIAIDRVALRWRMRTTGAPRAFLNGWQSWSASARDVR